MVPYDRLACRTHWFSLAKPLRDALWAAYNEHGVGSAAHTAAVDACIRALQGGAGGGRGSSDPLADLRRIYNVPPDIDFERPPTFLLAGTYAEMWRAWGRIQAKGDTAPDEAGTGWRVTSFPREGGGCTMRLEVDFLPTRPGR